MDTYAEVCDYFSGVYDDPDQIIASFEPHLEDREVDTLVGTGLSGGIIVPMMARHYGLEYMIVRKDGTGTHDPSLVYGKMGQHYVIVDDFVASGSTIRRIQRSLHLSIPEDHEYRMEGVWEYHHDTFTEGETVRDRHGWAWKPPKFRLQILDTIQCDSIRKTTFMLGLNEWTGKTYVIVRAGGLYDLFNEETTYAKEDQYAWTRVYEGGGTLIEERPGEGVKFASDVDFVALESELESPMLSKFIKMESLQSAIQKALTKHHL
jgi:hypothetical protein